MTEPETIYWIMHRSDTNFWVEPSTIIFSDEFQIYCAWCDENITDEWFANHISMSFSFSSKTAALIFKLRWDGTPIPTDQEIEEFQRSKND